MKGLNTAIQPSNHSSLLQLPTELLVHIADALDTANTEWSSFDYEPFGALRLTCKRLAEISAPTFFRSVCLAEVDADADRHLRLAENAQHLGGLVRHLRLILEDDLVDNNYLPIYGLLASMPNVQSLTIIHGRQDVAKHTPLQQAVEKFMRLEKVTIQEMSYNPDDIYESTPTVTITETFFHIFLGRVLEVHSRRLRALHLYTLLPLHPLLYLHLRDKTPNLQSITFTTNIGTDMADIFSEPTPWASGQLGHLENLTFQGCSGTNTDRLVRNILQGVYGRRLKKVRFMCSGEYLSHIPEPPTLQVFASLEHLQVDYINLQELSTIAFLPIQELSLTHLTQDAFCRLPMLLEGSSSSSGGVQPGFRGLKRLGLDPKFVHKICRVASSGECKAAYEELLERVLPRRGIQLSLDAVVTINMRCS